MQHSSENQIIKLLTMEDIVKMPHITFKPTQTIPHKISQVNLNSIEIPPDSKLKISKYIKSNELTDDNILLMTDNNLILSFDCLIGKEKLIIPEINPVTIFFSNALMSHRLLMHFRKKLLDKSPKVKDFSGKKIDPTDFGNFFQLATNVIVNLQATIESFANRIIPKNHKFIDKKNEEFEPSLFHKINTTLPELRNLNFTSKNGKQNNYIRQLINLRNEIIHLRPAIEVGSGYRIVYRKLINFKYTETIFAVRAFVNFYESGLIEDCSCGKEHFYNIVTFDV
jgi:hypothetical protein